VTDKDIIKQILFKFKSEGEDKIKRTADSLSKAMSPRDMDRYLKSVDQVSKKMAGTGNDSLLKSMQNVGKVAQEIQKKHFAGISQELDKSVKTTDKLIERMRKLESEGKSSTLTSSAIRQSMERTNVLGQQLPDVPQKGVRSFLAGSGGKTLASVAGVAMMAADLYQRSGTQAIENRVTTANRLKGQQLDVMNGNMELAAVMSRPGAKDRVKNDTNDLNRRSDLKAIGQGVLGAIMVAGGIAGTAVTGGIGGLVGGAVALGGVSQMYGTYDYFANGGRARQKGDNVQLAIENEKSKSLAPEMYQEFAKTADMRYQYQRQLGLGDESALGMRSRFRRAGVIDEGEMANTMMRFRRFGKPAAELGANSAIQAQKYGMSGDIMSQFMGTTAAYNKSGPNSAMEEVAKAVEKGMERGIDNSGMMEVFQKQVDTTMELFKGRMDRGAAADVVGSYLSGPATARQLEALPQAMQGYANTIGGASGFEKTKKTAGLMALSHGDMDKFNLLSNLSDQQLADMPAAQLAEYAGISPSEITQFKKDRIESTVSSVPGERGPALLKKLRSGKTLSSLEKRILATSGGNNIASWQPEAVDELMQKYKNGENIEGNYKAPGTDLSGTNTAANEAIKGKAIGGNIKDSQVHEEVGKHIKSIAGDFQNQASEVKKSLESGALAGSIEGIADATHEIVLALKGAATSIRNGTSSAPRAQPAKPGGTN
jgi:hypothetical protein